MDTNDKKQGIDFLAYHKSLATEMNAVKDRVRHLLRHWPTDGMFKESVLRSVLRRHLPESLFIGTGFIVTASECSKQIDVLITDKARPRLFWDGDLVIVTPDAVRAVIEVKTGLDSPASIEKTIMKLASNKKTWCNVLHGWDNWLGLFVFEARGKHEDAILLALDKARKKFDVRLDCVAYGPDLFVDNQGKIGRTSLRGFVAQQVDGLAAACFVTKLVNYFSQTSSFSNPLAWQPHSGKATTPRYLAEDGDGTIQTLDPNT